MNKQKKILLTLIFIFSVLIILTFISFKIKKNYTQKTKQVVFITLQLYSFKNYINNLISEFEKQNPDIKIIWIDVPYNEGEKRILATLLTDNVADLVNLNLDFANNLASKHALEPIPQDTLKQQFLSSMIDCSKVGKEFFSIPFYATSQVTLINSKLLAKSGLNRMNFRSYDDIFKYASIVKEKTGKFISLIPICENDTLLKIFLKYNINPDDGLDEKEKYSQNYLYSNFKNMYKKNLIPKETITQTHCDAIEKYMAQEILLISIGANFLNMVKENAPELFDYTIVNPQLIGKNGQYDFSLMTLNIPIKSKNKHSALKFALFLTNEQNQLKFSQISPVLPSNKFALKKITNIQNSYDKMDFAKKLSAQQLTNLLNNVINIHDKRLLIEQTNYQTQKILLQN